VGLTKNFVSLIILLCKLQSQRHNDLNLSDIGGSQLNIR
jgi:hypothetical protein